MCKHTLPPSRKEKEKRKKREKEEKKRKTSTVSPDSPFKRSQTALPSSAGLNIR
jgi:hypothetical protein